MDADQALAGTGGEQTAERIDTTIAPPSAAKPKPLAKAKSPSGSKAPRAARKSEPTERGDPATTKPRPRDENGRALDAHGLPLNGPARVRALEALGKPDPDTHPDQWPAQGEAQE